MGKKEQPTRLVYGSVPWAGYDGIVMDAAEAERFAAAAQAKTQSEFQAAYHQCTWEQFIDEWREDHGYEPDDEIDAEDEEQPPLPDDPFSFGEWLASAYTSPEAEAWTVAHRRVDEIIAEGKHPMEVESGGGSPGGNTDAISGSMQTLDYIASRIEPSRDGFSLERDEALVQSAMPRDSYM